MASRPPARPMHSRSRHLQVVQRKDDLDTVTGVAPEAFRLQAIQRYRRRLVDRLRVGIKAGPREHWMTVPLAVFTHFADVASTIAGSDWLAQDQSQF